MIKSKKIVLKRMVSIIVTILIIFEFMPDLKMKVSAAESWDGTSDTDWYDSNPTNSTFTISTAKELAGLAQLVNGGTTFFGKTVSLAADISLNDISNLENWAKTPPSNTWTPIGSYTNLFWGTFDGNSHVISGIYIDSTSNSVQGLLGGFNGILQNLGLVSGYIRGDQRVAGMIGYSIAGTVTNCYNTVSVTAKTYAGGIVGRGEMIEISNCYNTGEITCPEILGGIVGYLSGKLTNCYNKGELSGYAYIGGLAGWADLSSKLLNCYNEGIINGNVHIAGIAGENDGEIKSCYNVASVTTGSLYSGLAGGIAGSNYGSVTDSYNTGEVSSFKAGGIAGINQNKIENTYYSGCSVGIGGGGSLVGTEKFVTLSNSSITVGDTTTIIENSPACSTASALGADFTIEYTNYNSPYATINGKTVTGTTVGSGSVIGNMNIKHNGLTSSGFTGAITTISVPISVNITVNPFHPTITLSSISSPIVGENITLTATLANGYSPTGTVTFKDGALTLGSTNTITNGVATIIYSTTSTASLNVTAVYSGDANNATATSAIQVVAINKKQPILSLTAIPASPGTFPNAVTVSATLDNVYGSVMGQSVVMTIDGTTYSTTTNASGIASYTFTPSSVKDYALSASYVGKAYNFSATSGILTYIVNKGTQTALTITNLPTSITYGDSKFTLDTTGGSGTGGVTYSSSNSGILNVNATTGEVTIVAAGTAAITATKAADANYNSTSAITSLITVIPLVNAQIPTFDLNLSEEDTTYYLKDPATTLSVSATVPDAGTVSYQWYKNSTNSTTGGAAITGETKATFTPSTDTIANQFYYVIATNTNNAVNGTKIATQTSAIKQIIVIAKTVEITETPNEIQNAKLISAVPQETAFNQSVEIKITNSTVAKQVLETALVNLVTTGYVDTTIIPIDINVYLKGTSTKVQPHEGTCVTITYPIPENLLVNKDKLKVVGINEGNPTFIDTKVILVDSVYCVQFSATRFSPYGLVVYYDTPQILVSAEVPINTESSPNAENSPKTADDNLKIPFAMLATLSLFTIQIISKKHKLKVIKKVKA